MSLLATLSESPYLFLQPTPEVSSSAIALVKDLLDPLASNVAETQKKRRSRKRKRESNDEAAKVLQIRTVHTNGLNVKQVWEQARRVLDAACAEVEHSFQPSAQDQGDVDSKEIEDGVEDYDRDIEAGTDDQEEEDEEIEDAMPLDDAGYPEADSLSEEEEEEEEAEHEDILDEQTEDDDFSDESPLREEVYKPDPNGLNDGFFSIDEFNHQSQFLEQQDVRGEDDNPSDEDEIDWDADPLTMPIPQSKRDPEVGGDDESDPDADEDDDAGGPTFGNADLDASESENGSVQDGYLDDGMPGLGHTNEIRYADFFEPPPKKPSKTKRMRALPKSQPPDTNTGGAQRLNGDDQLEADVQRAMADVNRDMFASESDVSDSANDSDTNPSGVKNLSTHEKQRAKIAAEIQRLEAASVAKRDWTLSGEARAADRPLNSLIEEDLEFERVGKPVPVITAEVTEEIEELIKRRILAREFDEVIRRRPDAIGAASDTRRGRVEVDDTRPQAGLAEIYEQDHLRATDPGYVDKRSAATKKQHEEIDKIWKEVSYQLDLLSNLHFKPKRVDMEIKTVEDKPRISMEDARPAGEGIGVDDSMLAPQEVYRAGDVKRKGEVARKSGMSTNKEEMSREEKLRKRRREKERAKKGKGNAVAVNKSGTSAKKGKVEAKQGILEELRKGNVKVIDKKGEMQNLGRENGQTKAISSSALKL